MHAICSVDAPNAFGASTEFIWPKAFIYLDLREKLFSLNGKLNISVISVFSFFSAPCICINLLLVF
jgi:hypothetical protein